MTLLLDGNVLVALAVADHVHHDAAERWFPEVTGFATCPITQGTLLRLLLQFGVPAPTARESLRLLDEDERHTFWSDDVSYVDVSMTGVLGHRQVTDAYLAQLGRQHSARLASFDPGLAAAHPDVVDLVPVDGAER